MNLFILDPTFLHVRVMGRNSPVWAAVIVLPEVRRGEGEVLVNVWIVDKNFGISRDDNDFRVGGSSLPRG